MILHLMFSSEYPYSASFEDLCRADVYMVHFKMLS